jgi:hypothetical protein
MDGTAPSNILERCRHQRKEEARRGFSLHGVQPMRQSALAGPKTAAILPKTVAACLADDVVDLPYNWSGKVRTFVLGICLARSTVLQDIARMVGRDSVKKSEKALSEFLRCHKLALEASSRKHAIKMLRRLGKRRFYRYRGKLVLIVDSTTYVKLRSRGKKRRMPKIGKVVLHNLPAKETLLGPGYSEFWTGLLLKDETCLGITRRLYTEETLPVQGFSQNALEEVEICAAIDLVKQAFGMGVILVADRGFRRKDLLSWLKDELRVDFVIRIEGNLNVKARGWKGLLSDLAQGWPERLRRFWRDDSKDAILSKVRGSAVEIPLDKKGKQRISVNVVHLTAVNHENLAPMFLATTLPIGLREELSKIVSLYSKRWTIETFFETWKEALGTGAFRVFSCWEAIDRLLAMAHMALLVLYLLFVLAQEARRGKMKALWGRLDDLLRRWIARPPEMTLGQFFNMLALDTSPTRWMWMAR